MFRNPMAPTTTKATHVVLDISFERAEKKTPQLQLVFEIDKS